MQKIITTSIILSSLLIAGNPIHNLMDHRIKGKSFSGTLDDNQAAQDGLGVLPLQHHSGTSEINNELLVQQVFDRVLKTETDPSKITDIRTSLTNGTVGTLDDQNLLNNYGLVLGYPAGSLATCDLIKTQYPTSQPGSYKLSDGSTVNCDFVVMDKTYNDSFSSITSAWQTWGSPLPRIVSDSGASNGVGFDNGGDGSYHSGAVLNGYPISTTKKITLEFRVKQPRNGTGYWDYMYFGLTSTPGISSTTNGRSGTSLGFLVDGGMQNKNSSNQIARVMAYSSIHGTNWMSGDYYNTGDWRDYKIEYNPHDNYSLKLYEQGILRLTQNGVAPTFSNFYVYIDGRTYGPNSIVDYVKITHE